MTNADLFKRTCAYAARDGWILTFMLFAMRTNDVAWAQAVPWWAWFCPPLISESTAALARWGAQTSPLRGWLTLLPLVIANLAALVLIMSGRLA